jgi:hypothetical protein
MSSDADDGIHLRVKRFRAPKGLHRNAVLLDFIDGAFEMLFANKCQKPNKIVRPPEYARRQDVVYFSPFGLKFADRRLQVPYPQRTVPLNLASPFFGVSITEFSPQDTGQAPIDFNGLKRKRYGGGLLFLIEMTVALTVNSRLSNFPGR